jgi:hypothetical protein
MHVRRQGQVMTLALPVMAMSRPPSRLTKGNDGEQLVILARVRKGDEHVVTSDHAQVAMHRFGCVHEIRRVSRCWPSVAAILRAM